MCPRGPAKWRCIYCFIKLTLQEQVRLSNSLSGEGWEGGGGGDPLHRFIEGQQVLIMTEGLL